MIFDPSGYKYASFNIQIALGKHWWKGSLVFLYKKPCYFSKLVVICGRIACTTGRYVHGCAAVYLCVNYLPISVQCFEQVVWFDAGFVG